jgi:hypothetical protein
MKETMNEEIAKFVPDIKKCLEDLKEIEKRGCNEYSITDLGTLIQYAYQLSTITGIENFKNNINQTIEKQWYYLNLNKLKPKKRSTYWSETINNLRTDLIGAIVMADATI